MIKKEKVLLLYKWMFVALLIAFIGAVITIISIFYGIKDCEVEYGEIIEWGYQNSPPKTEFIYFEEVVVDSAKFVKYRVNKNVVKLDINESGDLEIIKELFPVEEEYIITTCDGELEGFARRGIINDLFLYKLAKII